MADFFEEKGIAREAGTSIVLNTFMYADRCRKFNNNPLLENVVDEMYSEKDNYEDTQKAAIKIVRDHIKSEPETSEVRRLKFINFSDNMGEDYKGAYAAAFKLDDENGAMTELYVVFRGTGSGRWYDNGQGLYQDSSKYQKVALKYFNDTLRALDIRNSAKPVKLVVTGHSKGGNLSQFVTFSSEYKDLVTCCISFDGQGFSPERFEVMQSDSNYEKLRRKMYSVCGDNDYVNVLGKKLIPDENTVYIATKPFFTDMYAAHSIVPQYYSDVVSHRDDFLYNFSRKCFNNQTSRQRQLAECSKAINDNTMKMNPEERAKTCNAIMTLAEQFLGGNASPEGLCGEKATTGDFIGFISNIYNEIIPLTAYVGKEAGNDVIFTLIVRTDAENAYLLTATRKQRIEYMMSNPDAMTMYYFVTAIAFESIVNNAADIGCVIGKAAAPEWQSRITLLYKAYSTISNFISVIDIEDFFKFLVIISTSMIINGTDVNALISFFEKVLLLSLNKTSVRFINGVINIKENKMSSAVSESCIASCAEGSCTDSIINAFCGLSIADLVLGNEEKEAVKEAVAYSRAVRILEGTEGDDGIIGEETDEIIRGHGGDDGLHGNGGNDEIYGGDGSDRIYGGAGSDRLYGERGDDMIYGGADDDYVDGGEGNDLLKGGVGNDTVRGGIGDDTLFGDGGNDILFGGLDNDRYIFSRGFGSDVINDTDGENIIEFRNISPDELKAEFNEKGELIICMKAGTDRIRIRNYSAGNFGFVFDSMNYRLAEQGDELVFARI